MGSCTTFVCFIWLSIGNREWGLIFIFLEGKWFRDDATDVWGGRSGFTVLLWCLCTEPRVASCPSSSYTGEDGSEPAFTVKRRHLKGRYLPLCLPRGCREKTFSNNGAWGSRTLKSWQLSLHSFIHSFTHSLNKLLLNAYYVVNTYLGTKGSK